MLQFTTRVLKLQHDHCELGESLGGFGSRISAWLEEEFSSRSLNCVRGSLRMIIRVTIECGGLVHLLKSAFNSKVVCVAARQL